MSKQGAYILDLPGDLATGKRMNRATPGSEGECKGGQTGTARFSALFTRRQTATGSRSGGGGHHGNYGVWLDAGGLGLYFAVVRAGKGDEILTVEGGPVTDNYGEGGALQV